ncbi:MAG: hypothetical protein MH825_08595 [Cyanobacteria bacterium]|jgi:hypothetical protein|nr:hypothetical protein [Cyanobacteriota bacterium]
MSYRQPTTQLPAPCIVDEGTVVSKLDMQKLLAGLGRVYYTYRCDGAIASEGEGVVIEVFADERQATLVANRALYLNVCSFDYLELKLSPNRESYFNLVQDRCILTLQPLTDPLRDRQARDLDDAALEAMFDRVLLTHLDANDEDERFFL